MQKCSKPKANGTNDISALLNEEVNKSTWKSMLRLLNMLFQSSPFGFMCLLILSVIGGMFPIAVSVIWKDILSLIEDKVILTEITQFYVPFIILAIVGGLSVSFSSFSEISDTYFRNKISMNLQKHIHTKVENLPVSFFEIPQLNDTIKRAQDVFCYGSALGAALSITSIISTIVSLVASGIMLWGFHYTLALLPLLIALPNCMKFYLNQTKVDFNIRMSSKRREASEYIQYFTKYEYVKETQVLNVKNFFLDKWQVTMGKIKIEEVKMNLNITVLQIVLEILSSVGYIGSIFLSSYLLFHKIIHIGDFGAIIYLISQLRGQIEGFLNEISGLHEELLNVSKGFDYLDLKEEIRDDTNVPNMDGPIICENVTYSYPLTNKTVIHQLNLKINKREVVAFVGLNGAGKSTLAKLLLGLLTPDQGLITYNNVDINDLSYAALHENMSAVFQDFNHYFLSIKENIVLSDVNKKEDSDALDKALSESGAYEFVQRLTGGINTNLGKKLNGIELSGGQWQQLALARGFFRNRPLILLDEPSSALDPFHEAKIYENFKTLCKDKTSIIVTHRIGVASFADRIVFFENGNIVEEGTHDELHGKKGRYWEFYERQAVSYRETAEA